YCRRRQKLRLLDGTENNLHPDGKQESPFRAARHKDRCATASDVHRTPSPTDISRTAKPWAAPNSRTSAGKSGLMVSAISAGPAPESAAAIPQRRSSCRYSADAGIALARCG